VPDHQPLSQSVHEGIEFESLIERAERRSSSMGALIAFADRMTLRTHSLGESLAALLQRTWPVLLGGTDRHSEEQKQDREPDGHFEHPQVDSEHRKGLPFLPRTALRKINLPEAKVGRLRAFAIKQRPAD
jgi:hypothetical protein